MELRDYLWILRMHWIGAGLIVLLVVLGAAGYTATRDEVYAANASGFVSTGASDNAALSSIGDELAKSRATSYVDIAKSRATAQHVIGQLALQESPAGLVGRVSVSQPVDTVLVKITARGSTAAEAQTLADAWVAALAAQVAAIEDPQNLKTPGTPTLVPLESAELPGSPISPNPKRNLALAVAVGLLLAFGYALLRHNLDRRLRTPEDVEEKVGRTVVGTIPVAPSLARDARARAMIVVNDEDRVPLNERNRGAAEAFRKLRTNLMYMDVDSPPRVIVVTSPRAGDGKSTVAANLAAAVAFSGQSAVLVDGDLRRPSVASALGLLDEVGLTDVLVGAISLEDALQASSEHADLQVLAAGKIPPNPSELLGSKAMKGVLAELATRGVVIVDAPPLLPVTDAAVLTAQADGALLVISAGRTLDTELKAALANLSAVNGRSLGVILNRAKRGGSGAPYAYDGYYYAPAPGHRRSRQHMHDKRDLV